MLLIRWAQYGRCRCGRRKTAIECIDYTRTQGASQATFLPLDTISTKPINKFRSFARGACLAADVIQYEPAIERAMLHACGSALIWAAVTSEGTAIHKGLITGESSTHGGGKKWEEKDVQGLTRLRDNFVAQLQELNRSKPRGKADENVIAEITRLESAIAVVRDDLHLQIPRELKKLSPELKKVHDPRGWSGYVAL
ncbi:hypothetical protein F4604DRAFT_2045670 [Suillus subluteus]|nr:hypothetical protein F4604DRAFT_2045670 [Suillus subluteus]